MTALFWRTMSEHRARVKFQLSHLPPEESELGFLWRSRPIVARDRGQISDTSSHFVSLVPKPGSEAFLPLLITCNNPLFRFVDSRFSGVTCLMQKRKYRHVLLFGRGAVTSWDGKAYDSGALLLRVGRGAIAYTSGLPLPGVAGS